MRPHETGHFKAHDGSVLFYRAWLPTGPVRQSVVLFHRGHEHSARFQELVDGLQLDHVAFFAWDARGHGHSPGERGHARGLAQLERDMQDFMEHLTSEHRLDPEQSVVIAHSVAAVVAGLWAIDHAPRLRGLVLATPALQVKLYVPFARAGLTALNAMGLMPNVQSYVRGFALTHDREQARAYDQDPLISKQIATHVLLDLYRGAERLAKSAGNLEMPVQVLAARADWVVKNKPIRQFFRKLPSPHKEIEVYRDFYHALFHEKERHQVFRDVRSFVLRCFERPLERQHLLQADRYGASQERYRWHQAGPPRLSLQHLGYLGTRLAMKTLGRLSQGLRLGMRAGFSSGPTLDYVYDNQPRGWTPLGRWLDQNYLQALGWRCIRVRRRHIEELLIGLMNSVQECRLVDLAGGPGGYLLDVLQAHPEWKLRALVRDRDLTALQQGEQRAAERGEKRLEFQAGDAFDAASLATLKEMDVAVVSGLYELFPENTPVRASLEGLARAVKPGGYLIYTNQPYHPQLELIAETLTHQDGSRWVMRCRSTAEMDELVRQAGFQKQRMLIDEEGIFSVSLARRLP